MPASRTRGATADQGRYRASIALAYLRAAEHVLDEDSSETNRSVVAGLAVLAGIAASDALCIRHLGYYAKGQDHDDAVDVLLETGTPASRKWSQTLKRLIDLIRSRNPGDSIPWKRGWRDVRQEEGFPADPLSR